MSIPFVHLHLHSHYSILDGLGKVEEYVAKAIELQMPALALTDHGVMYGVKDFLNAVATAEKKSGKSLKPIVGCEVYIAPEGRRVKNSNAERKSGYHLILLAKNLEGYYNLVKIVSTGYTEGFYSKPRIDREILERYHKNLICCSACLAGEVPQAIKRGNIEQAREIALWYKNLFGEDYYFEIQNHPTDIPIEKVQEVFAEQQRVNPVLFQLGQELGIKCVATNDCHFVNKEDATTHDVLLCVNTATLITEENRIRYTGQEYMKSGEEMAALNPGHPEILANTLEIAEKVERFDIETDHILPIFHLPEGFTDSNDYLCHLVYEGAKQRYKEILPTIESRIDFELETIRRMGFPDYFLIVQDFISYARSVDIWVGPGRGSAAGSVVAYCLGITNIDPIKYSLLFERFLNPDRVSMPDIDIDFEEERRNEVYEYVEKKYGKDHVSHVVTFGTMATKQSIKDAARVEGVDIPTANRLAGMVPSEATFTEEKKVTGEDGKVTVETKEYKVDFSSCLKFVPDFKKEYESTDIKINETMHYAQKLEGTIRQTGVHACAVIIGRDNLMEHIPISTVKGDDGEYSVWVSQYEGSHIESVGMLKMDFLGLTTLSILKESVRNIERHRGITIDLEKIPLDDKKTFKLFSRGDTVATFQFESPGMQKHLRELRPSRFEDLIAMNALYRPGPMQYIPKFIARKNGKEPISYELPEMEEILSDTYGVTVYQEQVMLLSQKLAKFTKGEADGLRKAMGKKKIKEMLTMETKFLGNGIELGFKREVLQKIWNDWKEFAKYAFNKSHSTCYAWLGYQTAYLKAHYPAEFMAANLTKCAENAARIKILMDECRRMGISVKGPDVNVGGVTATVTGDKEIRFGLAAIKGLGTSIANDIVANAPYKDIFDFVERASTKSMNRKALESLIYAGAFDTSFPDIRRDQYTLPNGKGGVFLDSLIDYMQRVNSMDRSVESLFGEQDEGVKFKTPEVPAAPPQMNSLEVLKKEREMVGMYISSHPLDTFRFELENFCNITAQELESALKDSERAQSLEGKVFLLGGLVTSAKERVSKNGRRFGSFTLEGFNSSMEFTLFGKLYEQFMNYIKDGNAIVLKIEIVKRYKENTMDPLIKNIRYLSNIKEEGLTSLEIALRTDMLTKELREDLVKLIESYKSSRNSKEGSTALKIRVIEPVKGFVLEYKTAKKISVDNLLLTELSKMGIPYRGKFNTTII